MNTIFLAEWWSEYLLPSAASLAVFYLLYKLVIRNDTYLRSRRFLILAFLLFAIMLPFLSFQLPMNITASTVENPVFYRDIISTPTPVVATEMASPAADNIAENTISIWDIVGLIYAAVVLFLLIRFIAGVLHLAIIAKNGKRIQANGATIILSPNFTTAFSFFHLTFMPETWYNSNERNVVLKHEHVHIVQKHSWDLVLMELICVVQFFNPFVWLLRHEMRLNHEFLADRGALESSNNTAQYFQLLLQKILGKQPILVNSFNYSPIKQRIIMTTLKKQAKILSSARYFAFVLVALSLTILFAGKANSTTSTTASTSENTKYLFLNAEQLKPLGVELSEKGLFYLNKNPKKNSEYTHFIAFHAGENNRACEPQDIHFNPKEIENDPVFKDKNVTNNEIYIKQITNPQGSFQYASHTISGKENENTECIPVAICMSETKIKSRIDTIVFWFYPTKALQRALPKGIKMTDYLMTPKQQPYDGAKEFYKNLSSNAEMWKMLIISLGYGEGGDFPNYPEGGEAFYKYLKENIKYPEALDSKNFKGAIATVVVEFHVEKDGSISRIEPFCYINSDNKTINLDKDNELIVNSCNEEAVHVVKNMPKWIPSKDYEYMSQFRVTLPIIFSLTD